MTHVLTLALCLPGFALLLLAMPRHQQDWLRRKLPKASSRKLRGGGFALLALAFLVSGWGLGWAYGTVAWCGWMTLSALAAVTANTNRERIQRLKVKP
jgi:hypothetical protein